MIEGEVERAEREVNGTKWEEVEMSILRWLEEGEDKTEGGEASSMIGRYG